MPAHVHVRDTQRPLDSWDVLRRFARPRKVVALCELCAAELSPEHQHLVVLSTRQLLCACDACAVLFDHQGDSKYRHVPRRNRFLSDFRLTDIEWNSLAIPVGLAFFSPSTPTGKVLATYPSPAGPTESVLDPELWDMLVAANPILQAMAPDVEALLVNRIGQVRDHFLAPLDACYELIGLIRSHWQGLSGGTKVRQAIERFFSELMQKSTNVSAIR